LFISNCLQILFDMKYKLVGVISLIILLIVVDQLSKYLFYNLQVWSNIFFLYPLLNEWISWWLSMPMFITITVSIVCSVLFIYLYYKKYLTAFEFALLFAWTIWNLVDRIFLWWVRDFLSFWSFPVFNIADSFLTCWVAWICIKEIFHLQNKQKNLP
jgi:signal peptidase II